MLTTVANDIYTAYKSQSLLKRYSTYPFKYLAPFGPSKNYFAAWQTRLKHVETSKGLWPFLDLILIEGSYHESKAVGQISGIISPQTELLMAQNL